MLRFVPPKSSVRRLREAVALWYGRWSSRRQLARMDDRMLRDIGLGPPERSREARKPFWRP